MTEEIKIRGEAIKKYWSKAKVKCPFQDEDLQTGYLEGFIEGVVEVMQDNKWHDLRKDPKDLPKLKKGESFKTVLIYTKQYCHDWYDTASYSDGSFFINGEDGREKVIAWREVPKFQKESK